MDETGIFQSQHRIISNMQPVGHLPDNIVMFQCFNKFDFLLYVLVLALGLFQIFDVQLDHLHRYQLACVRQAAPNLQNPQRQPVMTLHQSG